MERNFISAGAVLLLLLSVVTGSANGPKIQKNVFLGEKGCPLLSVFPVIGSGFLLKNVGQKTITSYTLACLENGKKRKIDFVFAPVREIVRPDETTGEFALDGAPPNICRSRKRLLGVYEVKFSDGTSWTTTAPQ